MINRHSQCMATCFFYKLNVMKLELMLMDPLSSMLLYCLLTCIIYTASMVTVLFSCNISI